jgi:hypothetical protein
MTPAGRLIVSVMVMVAAVVTAKYLHQAAPVDSEDARPASRTPTLHWQSSPQGIAGAVGLTPVPRGDLPPIQFAQLTSAVEVLAPPKPFEASPVSANGLESASSVPALAARSPFPFTRADRPAPQSTLVDVDDEETTVLSPSNEFVHHTVQFGETLPQIALQYTGKRESYMTIYEANLDVLSNPAEVPPGTVLKIPLR